MIFNHLRLIDDRISHDGAWNMAVDEMLASRAESPTLRVYSWARPTVSIGYFEKWNAVRKLRPGAAFVRRWTGGGLVDHGDDWTYSLVVPHGEESRLGNREESYCNIHRAIRDFVRATKRISLELALKATADGADCFANPVRGDLLFQGRKIAGAAQRRTRRGLLHQGSIQHIPFEKTDTLLFANTLARTVETSPLLDVESDGAAQLVATRYGLQSWLERF